eukprot:GHVO01028752.1.p1 GENE.GHVO01028752.1~~GHVO01028752.1.p1  ORF type:complete len:124 (-),score=6.08 GHVO01028752.1:81-452(-)
MQDARVQIACRFTFVSVTTTVILNGFTMGLIFTKFSSATARKYSLLFSDVLCLKGVKKYPIQTPETAAETSPIQDVLPTETIHSNPSSTKIQDTQSLQFRIVSIATEPFFNVDLRAYLIVRTC